MHTFTRANHTHAAVQLPVPGRPTTHTPTLLHGCTLACPPTCPPCKPTCTHVRMHACTCTCTRTHDNQIYCQTIDGQSWGTTGENLRVPCVLPGGLECQNFDNLNSSVSGCSDYKVQCIGSHARMYAGTHVCTDMSPHPHAQTHMQVKFWCEPVTRDPAPTWAPEELKCIAFIELAL